MVLTVAIFSCINLYNYAYPELNKDAVQFFFNNKKNITEENNSLYARVGFGAPSEVDDIYEYGQNLINKSLGETYVQNNKHYLLESVFNKFENELIFHGDSEKLLCWLEEDKYISDVVKEACYTSNELVNVINDNTILLKRHEQLKNYTQYDDKLLFGAYGSLLINAHRLFLSDIRLQLESNNEEAIKKLIDDLNYFRGIMRQPANMVTKAIHMVLYGLSLNQLGLIVKKYPHLTIKHKEDIINVLNDISDEEFNLDDLIRQEFKAVNYIFCIDENLEIKTNYLCQPNTVIDEKIAYFIINDFYDFYLNFKYIFSLESDEMKKECQRYAYDSKPEDIYRLILLLPFFKMHQTYILLMDGIIKGCEIMVNHKSYSSRHDEIKSYLESYQ